MQRIETLFKFKHSVLIAIGLRVWHEKYGTKLYGYKPFATAMSGQQMSQHFNPIRRACLTGTDVSINKVYENLRQRMVGVVISEKTSYLDDKQCFSGSGVIVDDRGYLLTNCHIAQETLEESIKIQLFVKLKDGSVWFGNPIDVQVVYVEPQLDLALIRTKQSQISWRTGATNLFRTTPLEMGEDIVAVGNPSRNYSVVEGVVMNPHMHPIGWLTTMGDVRCEQPWADNSKPRLAHTCKASHGFSGGCVVDLNGKVVAIHSAGTDDQRLATDFVDTTQFIERGKRFEINSLKRIHSTDGKKCLGITVFPFNDELKIKIQKMPNKTFFGRNIAAKGLVVMESLDWMSSLFGSEGDNVNQLKKFDIITKVNGKIVNSLDQLNAQMEGKDELDFNINRNGVDMTIRVKPKPFDLFLI